MRPLGIRCRCQGSGSAWALTVYEMELGGVWYRLEEYYYNSRQTRRQKTDQEYADDLEALVKGRPLGAVVVDPSAASFIEVLRRRGLPVRKANNDVLSGIRLTARLLKEGKLVAFPTETVYGLGRTRFRKRRPGRPMRQRDAPQIIH